MHGSHHPLSVPASHQHAVAPGVVWATKRVPISMVANERPNEVIARRVGQLEVVDPSQRISEISVRWVAVLEKSHHVSAWSNMR